MPPINNKKPNKRRVKFKPETTKNGIWTDWIRPVMNKYHMMCCDCGLVHTINFRAIEIIKVYKNGVKQGKVLPKNKFQVEMKMYRNNKLTKKSK